MDQKLRELSPVFYDAGWDLCRRGILRPGVKYHGAQAKADGGAGNGYTITPFGHAWLKESGKDDFVPTEPERFGCGTIIWESKRTKEWSEAWIEKLKNDQREAKAEIAVLVTTALPKEVSHFEQINGVWVTHPTLAVCLSMALKTNLIQVANTKLAATGKNEKMEALYSCLSGSEFSQRIEAIVGSFITMKNDLKQEKRAMNKIWAKREKQIERVIGNLSGM